MVIDYQILLLSAFILATIIIIIPLLLLFIHIYFPYLIYGFNFSNETPNNYGIDFTDVMLKTSDGITLHCWDMPNDTNKGYVVVCHGVASHKNIYLNVANMLYSEGYSVFMADFRAHGKSKWTKITYGYNEINDIKAIIDYLKSMQFHKIAIYGHSMGAAVSLLSAGKMPEINAVICDGCFVSVEEILKFRMFFLPTFLVNFLYKFSEKAAWWVYGIKLPEIKPIDAVNIANKPIMYICGMKDLSIPPAHSKTLFEHTKTPQKKLYEIPGTPHKNTMKADGYKEQIVSFLDENFR